MPTNPLLVILYTSPNLNRQYQNGQNTNQNQKKNVCPFYTVFQVLEVLLIKICKIQPLDLLFLFVYSSFYINRYHFSQTFKTSFSIIWNKDFYHKFSFFNRVTQTPQPLKRPKSAKHDKWFLSMFHHEADFVQRRKSATHHLFISYSRNLYIIIYIHKLYIIS